MCRQSRKLEEKSKTCLTKLVDKLKIIHYFRPNFYVNEYANI